MTQEGPSTSEIWRHHQDTQAARRCLAKSLKSGQASDEISGFYAMTERETRDALARLESEQDHQTTLFLFAATEARLFHQARHRLGKALARHMRAAADEQQLTLDHVLEMAKETLQWQPTHKRALGDFRQLVAYRNWLAHGRRWSRPSALGQLHPSLLRERVEALQSALVSPVSAPS